MKKIVLLILTLSLVLTAGCAKKEDTAKEDTKPVVKEKSVENEFVKKISTDTRPLAVMIDNDGPSSRPQIGLEDAYLVYEVIVEGGATRLMALFKDTSIEKVGPIRSSRHYFLDYALENDALYVHAGWSPKATTDISLLEVNNINGILGSDASIFYRDNTYDSTYHNLYSSVAKAYEFAEKKKKYYTTSDIEYTWYSNEDFDLTDGVGANEFTVPYSTLYTVNYKYNSDTKLYERYIGSTPHVSQTTDILTAKNIIICHVKNYPLNDGENKDRQEVETVGEGTGYYVTNGKAIEINWEKPERTERTIYTDVNGNEITINPGNTYIQIVPMHSEITFSE